MSTSFAIITYVIIALDHVNYYILGRRLMTDFVKALSFVLATEKGFVDHPNDNGGATNLGISLRLLKSFSQEKLREYGFSCEIPSIEDVRDMTLQQASAIYRHEFWQHSPFDQIKNQEVGNYIFDMAINMGISPSIKCAQRAIGAIMGSRSACVVDGILGKKTLYIINTIDDEIIPPLRSERAGDYRVIVAENPDQKIFIQGWLNRAYER